jgi:hypothetical protein
MRTVHPLRRVARLHLNVHRPLHPHNESFSIRHPSHLWGGNSLKSLTVPFTKCMGTTPAVAAQQLPPANETTLQGAMSGAATSVWSPTMEAKC